MKKKIKLRVGYNYDFHLVGIISHSKDYTVSWAISKVLNIEMEKKDDLEVVNKQAEKFSVSNLVFEDDFRRFTLLTNKVVANNSITQKLFIPSLGAFNYLLKIEEFEETSDVEGIFAQLRKAEKIDTLMKLDVKKVKEKENFLF